MIRQASFGAIALAMAGHIALSADAATRQPAAAGRLLDTICRKAGYADNDRRRCAQAMSALCRKNGVDPTKPDCWQWLVDRDERRALDIGAIRRR